jgi:hypothetical protein
MAARENIQLANPGMARMPTSTCSMASSVPAIVPLSPSAARSKSCPDRLLVTQLRQSSAVDPALVTGANLYSAATQYGSAAVSWQFFP